MNNCKTDDERTRTDQIIRPVLRGRDIKRGGYEWAGLYLICTFPAAHLDINKYSSIKSYLESGTWSNTIPKGCGKEKLEQIGQNRFVKGVKFKTRKKTNNRWFETQDSIAYMDDFSGQKIIYSETNSYYSIKIALDRNGYYTDKTCFIICGNSNDVISNLYRCLASPIFTWYMGQISPKLGESGISLTKDTVECFPAIEIEPDGNCQTVYDLTEEEMNFISSSVSSNSV